MGRSVGRVDAGLAGFAGTTGEARARQRDRGRERARSQAATRARGVLRALLAATVWLLFCGAVVVVLDVLTIARAEDASMRQAQSDLRDSLALAQAGLSGDGSTLVEAQVMAAHARSEASAAQQRMDHDPVLTLLRRIPEVNRQLTAAQRLNSLMVEAADMSVRGETLAADFQAARRATGKPSTLDVAGRFYIAHRAEIETLANRALALPDQVVAVDRGGLATPLRDAYDRLDRPMQLIAQQRDNVRTALSTVPVILGADHPVNYLLLFTDNAELRPGGGFIGTFGVLGFDHGAYLKPVITRVGLVEEPQRKLAAYRVGGGHYIRPPSWILTGFPDFAAQTMSLGNSASSPTFDDNQRLAQSIYTSETGKTVDGVIQIDLSAISYVVAVTGPIVVPTGPTSSVTITPESANDVLVAETRTNDKSLLGVFQDQLIARLETMPPAQLGRVFSALQLAAQERHLMMAMNAPALQALVDRNRLSRPVPGPAGDSILPVFANVTANKSDHHVERSIRATVQANGHHHVELTIVNHMPPTIPGLPPTVTEAITRFRELIRLYLPPDARQVRMTGFMPRNAVPGLNNPVAGDQGMENGWHTYGGWLQVLAGHRFTVSWDYMAPPIGRDFKLELVKQPGVETYPVEVTLMAPGYTSPDGVAGTGSVTWRTDLSHDQTLSASQP